MFEMDYGPNYYITNTQPHTSMSAVEQQFSGVAVKASLTIVFFPQHDAVFDNLDNDRTLGTTLLFLNRILLETLRL